MTDPVTTTTDHRSTRAAAILIELGYGADIATVACAYAWVRSWWEAYGEPVGGMDSLRLQIAEANPHVVAAAGALPQLWITATERMVDQAWGWICGDEPMPTDLRTPANMTRDEVLAEEMEIDTYVPVDAR